MSVLSMVQDPQFQSMSQSDQQASLAGLDSDFGKLSGADFQSTVTGLQKRAMSRPDLVAPPSGAARPSAQLDTSSDSGFMGAPAAPDWAVPSDNSTSANAVGGVAKGFVKEAGKTIAPGPKTAAAINSATGMSVPSTQDPGLQTQGTAEKVGGVGEGILEFVMGDEALKGLSIAEKLGVTAKLARLAEDGGTGTAIMSRILGILPGAARQSAVVGGQTLLKGGTPTQALETGALAGGVGTTLGVANEFLPEIIGSVRNAVRPVAEKSAQTQQGIADIARGTAGMDTDSPLAISPTAADPYGLRQVATVQVGEYKNAAQQLDKLSGNKFSEAQQAVADTSQDFTAAGKQAARVAETNLNNLVEKYRPQLESNGVDVDGMNNNYKAAMANNKIANFLAPTVQEAGSGTDALTAQIRSGPSLKEKILDLAQNQKDLLGRAGWTDQHINYAAVLARRMDTTAVSDTVKMVQTILGHRLGITAGAATGGYKGYQMGGIPGAVVGAGLGSLGGAALVKSPVVLWKILNSETALNIINRGMESGASPEVVAPYVAEELGKDPTFMQSLVTPATRDALVNARQKRDVPSS